MGPDDFLRRNYNSGKPRPNQPAQRPLNHAPARQHLPQRPIEGFDGSPQQRAVQDFRSQQQRPIQQTPAQPHTPSHPIDYSEGAKEYKQSKKKHRVLKLNKLSLAIGIVAALVVLGLLTTVVFKKDDGKQPVNKQPAVAPLVKPEFTVYYPSPMPSGISTAKGSITYSKDSFSFIMKQGGENRFFISEQPASTDPDFNVLKSKLAAPKDMKLTLGSGVTGALDSGIITAVKTDKNTLIVINCVKTTACYEISSQIFSAMQVNDDLDGLRRSNS